MHTKRNWLKIKSELVENDDCNITWNNSSSNSSSSSNEGSPHRSPKLYKVKQLLNASTDSVQNAGPSSSIQSPIIGAFNNYIETNSPIIGKSNKVNEDIANLYYTVPKKCEKRFKIPFPSEEILAGPEIEEILSQKLQTPTDLQLKCSLSQIDPDLSTPHSEIQEILSQEDNMQEEFPATEQQHINIEDLSQNSSNKETLIEFVSSQEALSSFTLTTDSSSGFSHSPVYSNLATNRKRNFKKNGFAQQAVLALKKQHVDTAIWKHEMFVNIECMSKDDPLIKSLKIMELKREYDKLIALCSNASDYQCLILFTSNYVDFGRICNGINFKLFPPYKIVKISYEHKEIDFILNVSKIHLT